VSRGFWQDTSNQVQFLETLRDTLNLQNEKNWIQYITSRDIINNGGSGLLAHFKGYTNLLRTLAPAPLDTTPTKQKPAWSYVQIQERKGQSRLHQLVKSIFPDEEIVSNYQLHLQGIRPMELDVYIPSLSLAFEYQGEQHFKPTVFGNVDAVRVQKERVR
jgi:hypothetical protein